jgi:GR25 family glycosyltransferase involved in LPS biosynthesis
MFNSYIINLDERTDRLNDFLLNLEEFGYSDFDFLRISAVRDSDFGGLGCAKSHLIALCDYIARGSHPYCLIVEDDFRFKKDFKYFTSSVIPFINEKIRLNVFMLAGTRILSRSIDENFVEIFEGQSASGYIVSRQYVPKLVDCFLRSIILMENFRSMEQRDLIYDRFSIDQTWKKLQQDGGWFSCTQMVGFQAASFSDIEKRNVDYSDISS